MMKLTLSKTLNFDRNSLPETVKTLESYIDFLNTVSRNMDYSEYESVINLPFDEKNIKSSYKVVNELTSPGKPKIKYILVVGIGGDNLGTRAIYDAVYGYYDKIAPERFPKLIFMDTVDPEFSEKIADFIKAHSKNLNEIVVSLASKSGITTETISNIEMLLNIQPKLIDRVVVTTRKNTPLWHEAEAKKTPLIEIPEKVGGRYSVFSGVGIFPLALAGINILELLAGAMEATQSGLSKNPEKNHALVSAAVLHHAGKSKLLISDNFFFAPELESLGKWYRQLLSESTGKTPEALTPTVSIGSSDLHSMLQLTLGGPKNKITTFVHITSPANDKAVKLGEDFPTTNVKVKGKSPTQVLDAIYHAAEKAYDEAKLPYMNLEMDNLKERELGRFIQFKIMEVMFLSKLLNVNAFDQPDVESYKKHTRKFLENEKAL